MNVGDAPWSATYDISNGYVYVTNSGSNSVSVINGTKLVGTVNVGSSPVHRSLRQRERLRLRANFGSNNVSVISGATLVGSCERGGRTLVRDLRHEQWLRLRDEQRFEQRERDQRDEACRDGERQGVPRTSQPTTTGTATSTCRTAALTMSA